MSESVQQNVSSTVTPLHLTTLSHLHLVIVIIVSFLFISMSIRIPSFSSHAMGGGRFRRAEDDNHRRRRPNTPPPPAHPNETLHRPPPPYNPHAATRRPLLYALLSNLTSKGLPMNSTPFSSSMALAASSALPYLTKPKPFLRPSRPTATSARSTSAPMVRK